MSRRLSKRSFDYSFLDWMRRKYKRSMPFIYKSLGWSRVRYYNHCADGVELPRVEIPNLARALNISIEQVYRDEYFFYFGHRGVGESSLF